MLFSVLTLLVYVCFFTATTTTAELNSEHADTTCGQNHPSNIWLGSEPSDIDEHPWNVILKYHKPILLTLEEPQEFYCGGALISQRHVLTAAHCVKGPKFPKFTVMKSVRFGEYNFLTDEDCDIRNNTRKCAPPPFEISVERIFIHEEYNPEDRAQWHDLALVKLEKKVSFNDYVRAVCLPVDGAPNKNYTDRRLIQAGWGIHNNEVNSTVKVRNLIVVRGNDYCEDLFRVKLGRTLLCGTTWLQGACNLDNGGFAMGLFRVQRQQRLLLVGVVALNSCNATIYTKVDQYIEWITDKMNL